MPHGKWREIDLQLPCWLQLTLLGWCLVSLPFPGGISFEDPVEEWWLLSPCYVLWPEWRIKIIGSVVAAIGMGFRRLWVHLRIHCVLIDGRNVECRGSGTKCGRQGSGSCETWSNSFILQDWRKLFWVSYQLVNTQLFLRLSLRLNCELDYDLQYY